MIRTSRQKTRQQLHGRVLLICTLLASAVLCPQRALAGFDKEQLAGFEVTELKGTVSEALAKEKVIEIVDPEGHTEVYTVGLDLEPLGLEPGDEVSLSVLDGLLVDLEPSDDQDLSFSREDIILPSDMGKLKKGMRVALASGTGRVIKLDRQDGSLSLMGPFGGINNLDVLVTPENDPLKDLNVGDLVDFRLVQPVAVDVRKLSRSLSRPSALRPPLASDLLRSGMTLKAELLESFEITHLHAIVTRLLPDQKVLEIEGPEGHNILVTSAVDLNSLKLSPGTEISMDILDGLVVDLRPATSKALSFERQDVEIAGDFGPVPKGTRVAMATGSAEVVRISRTDRTLSLRGPFGKVHNLDVSKRMPGMVFDELALGDLVEFRFIKPVAIRITPLASR
ncbi:hypothetical protein [Synechococcus sp. MVIR-18-1]|uniref:hypothetical protein n=1 Tax=Synechococcus sp. MVIR-18-1 TaxID=1386941 RepID=UPI00164587A8|nr:hypothetical protein [Synechococcus sp. MVIR-18-1]QNI76807.1 putative conserved secreted protein [Synechococcus sp. MVIR-18-1]